MRSSAALDCLHRTASCCFCVCLLSFCFCASEHVSVSFWVLVSVRVCLFVCLFVYIFVFAFVCAPCFPCPRIIYRLQPFLFNLRQSFFSEFEYNFPLCSSSTEVYSEERVAVTTALSPTKSCYWRTGYYWQLNLQMAARLSSPRSECTPRELELQHLKSPQKHSSDCLQNGGLAVCFPPGAVPTRKAPRQPPQHMPAKAL
jgi:hypothetical protein